MSASRSSPSCRSAPRRSWPSAVRGAKRLTTTKKTVSIWIGSKSLVAWVSLRSPDYPSIHRPIDLKVGSATSPRRFPDCTTTTAGRLRLAVCTPAGLHTPGLYSIYISIYIYIYSVCVCVRRRLSGVNQNIVVPPSWIVKLPGRENFKSSLRKSPRSKKGSTRRSKKSNVDTMEKESYATGVVGNRSFVVKPIPMQGSRPIIVFINPKSGGNQGAKLMQKFQWLLNPRQVFDLTQGGPRAG